VSATTSAFLDFLRIICALVVFSSHCAQHWNDQASAVIRPYAHHAVVVFFVLSGYVISHATFGRRGIGVEHYAVSRISRLYSVVIPALLLTALLQWVGVNLAPEAYAQASRGADVARYALAAVFMQNAWFLSSAPPTNAPLWSLSYEAWYYAGFGAALFAPSYTRKVMLVGLVCLVAGPNIVLLAPAWLLGVALYAIGQRKRILAMPTSLWLMAGMVFMAAAHTAFSDLPYPIGSPRV
jgi:peptidoglycan/LPS O-acetylase OafA/YrhL